MKSLAAVQWPEFICLREGNRETTSKRGEGPYSSVEADGDDEVLVMVMVLRNSSFLVYIWPWRECLGMASNPGNSMVEPVRDELPTWARASSDFRRGASEISIKDEDSEHVAQKDGQT